MKEKTSDRTISDLKSELDEAKSEGERSKKALAAKEEVEARQIEAIQNLTSANQQWEEESNRLRCKIILQSMI